MSDSVVVVVPPSTPSVVVVPPTPSPTGSSSVVVSGTTVGPQGPTGPTGPTGPGVPAGGLAGKVLAKKSNTDYDTEWVTATGGGGGTGYTYHQINVATTWTITHGLGYNPNIVVTDTNGNIYEGNITWPDVNTVIVTFSTALNGYAYLS